MLHPQSRAGSLSAHGPCAIIGKVIEPQIINLKGNFLNLMQTTDLSLNLIQALWILACCYRFFAMVCASDKETALKNMLY